MIDNSGFSRMLSGLDVILHNVSSCAITSVTGESLYVKGSTFADLGSLPYAGYTAQKYFSLQDKQSVILNDPFSGGTILSDITLVMGVSLSKSQTADVLFVSRIALRPELNFSETLEKNSFRIPPTPLDSLAGFAKKDVIDSIASAPQAPAGFKQAVEAELQKMERLSVLIRELFLSLFDGPLKKIALESFFSFTQKSHHTFLDVLPYDRAQNQLTLDDGSQFSLSIQNTQQGVHFDFAGTQLGPLYGLTNPSVLGICLGTLNGFLDVPLSVNHGQFKNIIVNTPSQSRLNSNFPQSTHLGHLMAAPQMSNLILAVLSKLVPKQSVAGHANTAFIEMQFKDSRFFERIAGGLGATSVRSGEDGWEIWGRQNLKPSFEEIERRFPIRIIRQELREGSGGRGLKTGGRGLRRSYYVCEDCKLRWISDLSKPIGFMGGSAGDSTQILYSHAGADPVELKNRGELELKAGDTVTVLSAGGGGYGRQET